MYLGLEGKAKFKAKEQKTAVFTKEEKKMGNAVKGRVILKIPACHLKITSGNIVWHHHKSVRRMKRNSAGRRKAWSFLLTDSAQ